MVMSEGALVYETSTPSDDRAEIGRRMGGASTHDDAPTQVSQESLA
jgi:hypothetical protein